MTITMVYNLAAVPIRGVRQLTGIIAQADPDPVQEETNNAFLELVNNVTDLVDELLPGIDVDALGPFGSWATNIVVLIATVLAVWAFIKVLTGWAKSTFASGGDKERIKEGKAQMRSAGLFLGGILGLAFVFAVIGWLASYVTG